MRASRAVPDSWLRTALEAADAATAVHLRWAGRVSAADVRRKAPSDFVTHVDDEAQAAALSVIGARHPDHAILAEEGEGDVELPGDGRPCWIVDPLDGTTNFLHGHPMHVASVALAVEGRAVVGAVACGPTGERWWAARGAGAWKNGRPVRVSGVARLEDALVGTGFPFKRLDEAQRYARHLVAVLRSSAGARRGGAAALDLCYLAEGRFDAFWETFLQPWDFAAGVVVVEEAGGRMDRVAGGGLPLEPGSVLGANGAGLLEALREVLEA
jgi:myo-inositol-1(or 4)-monophosphatase